MTCSLPLHACQESPVHVPAMSGLMALWKLTQPLPLCLLARASCTCVHMKAGYAVAGGCSQAGG